MGCLARVLDPEALLLNLIPSDYVVLGKPPSMTSVTRDTYPEDFALSLPITWRILQGIAAALWHLHSHGIAHGDVYAHNILYSPADGTALLSDFGAAFFYNPETEDGVQTQAVEVRAFGCLMEDLLVLPTRPTCFLLPSFSRPGPNPKAWCVCAE